MTYFVDFTIDNGCREDKHVAVVVAESMGEAMHKFYQYIDPKLKYDEVVATAGFTALSQESGVLCCDYEEDKEKRK